MVKKRIPIVRATALAVAATAAPALWPLGAHEGSPVAHETCELAGIRPAAGAASLLAVRGSLFAVVADRETASLQAFELPAGTPLPPHPAAPAFIDRVDIASPLASSFGAHAAAAFGDAVHLLYVDREREDRLLAKHVWRPADSAEWRFELVEPSGLPMALLGGRDGEPVPVLSTNGRLWARGLLSAAGGYDPAGRASPFFAPGYPPAGFVFWDAARGLVLGQLSDGRFTVRGVAGGRAVHAVSAGADGRPTVVTWDPDARRIFLWDASGSPPAATTVTAADGVSALALQPSVAGWVFVCAETRPAPRGRWLHEVFVLAPSKVGRPRYRRLLLTSGEQPVSAVAAVLASPWLYVLELRDRATVVRVRLP